LIFKELIKKKRDGKELTKDEIEFIVSSYTLGETPDYQMAALLMAIFFRGLSYQESLYLTDSMLRTGKKLEFKLPGILVDKHSTGGIGDKVSLVLAPVLAELGFKAPLLAGRALGFTGGTIDKLESTGMKIELSKEEIEEVLSRFGFSISAQTQEIAPADRKIYALRDATATVESIPLIVSSILSKKLAVNTFGIVFDVKVGSGAFMKGMDEARKLAKVLVEVSKLYGKKAGALITEMGQPLGLYAGNALEVLEAIEALSGKPQEDLLEVVCSLCALLYEITGKDYQEGYFSCREVILEGRALNRFVEWVEFLGGSTELNVAANKETVVSETSGFVKAINGEALGYLIVELGGGRNRAQDEIDYSVGLSFFKKVGDRVEKGEPIGEVYYNRGDGKEWARKFLSAYSFSEEPTRRPELVKEKLL
jgi:pyrimidine-nucleoside phosphorylase